MTTEWWLQTLFLAFWLACVVALFLHIRKNIRKARERGWVDNGLGMRFSDQDTPATFRLIVYGWHFVSAVGVVMIVGGVVGMVVQIGRAL